MVKLKSVYTYLFFLLWVQRIVLRIEDVIMNHEKCRSFHYVISYNMKKMCVITYMYFLFIVNNIS